MATGLSIAHEAAGFDYIDTELYGTKWNTPYLTYSFPTSIGDLSDYGAGAAVDPSYFGSMTSAEQNAFRAILQSWAAVSGLTFTDVASGGDIRAYWYRSPDNMTARIMDYPSAAPEAGDIQLGNALGGDWSPGGYTYFTLLHELGHALGLKHTHDSINGFPAADAAFDSIEVSVMSYRSYAGGPIGGYSIASGSYPTGPMLNDIAAIQHLYGANWSTNSGDTTYTFDPSAVVVFSTIWDGGGNDTYNFANYSTDLTISLLPAAWSDLGAQYAVLDNSAPGGSVLAKGNIANSYLYKGDTRSLIENAIGGYGNDRIIGNQAANVLIGGTGSDTLTGGSGNDTFSGTISQLSGDTITDLGSGDRIFVYGMDLSSLQSQAISGILSLGAGSVLTLAGAFADKVWKVAYDVAAVRTILMLNTRPAAVDDRAAADASGRASGNVILGGANGAGRDTDADHDALIVTLDTAPIYGIVVLNADGTYSYTAKADVLRALGAGQTLTDTFTYIASDQNGGASSAVVSIVLHGRQDTISGGAGNDRLVGGSDGERLYGYGGNDRLYGGRGHDRLDGGTGSDYLSGGIGNDTMMGGAGNDVYLVDSRYDRVVEGRNAGIDVVYSSVNHTLGANVETLVLTGAAATGIGNLLANTLRASGRNATLKGMDGNDRLYGGRGHDRLDGGTGSDYLSGGNGNDTVIGGIGDDVLYGGQGADLLEGGSGRDAFVFNTKPKKGAVDKILGFNPLEDRIVLDSAVFDALGGPGIFRWDALRWGAKATDSSDRILYDFLTGSLSYDADGSGSAAAVQFAKVSPWLWLTRDDFRII